MLWSRIADTQTCRATLIVLAAAVVGVLAIVVGSPVAGQLKDRNDFEDPGSASVRAREALTRASGVSPEVGFVAVVAPELGASSPAGRRLIARVARVVAEDPAVGRVEGAGADARFLSRDGRRAFVAASFKSGVGAEDDEVAGRLARRLAAFPEVLPGGRPLAGLEISERVRHDLARAELLVFPALFLLSLWLFRGLVAALLTPLVGLLAILVTLLALRAVDAALPVSVYALNLVTGLGLGLAIDYSLLMIWRYREELARSGPGREAILATLKTAGRTIVFGALTIAAAMASLTVFPQRFLYSMGIGGAVVAVVAAVAAVGVLPAVLALLGNRVDALAPRRRRRAGAAGPARGWTRVARWVTRRPRLAVVIAVAFLAALALPIASVRFTGVDGHALPAGADARRAAETLERDFRGAGASAYIAITGPRAVAPELDAYAGRLERVPGVVSVAAPRPVARDTWRIDVNLRGEPLGEPARGAVHAIRAEPLPHAHLVGGQTAAFVDQQRSLASHLPLGLLIIAVTTQLMVLHMTRSVVLSIKAFITNLLSAAAAFGVLVLVFQHGRLTGVLGYTSAGALDATQPILLFALAFALSTDYGLFLLARIKEGHDSGLSDPDAVANGLVRTGRTITGSALLFCVAIGALTSSSIVFIKELGVGVVAAVAIDATVIRILLVPGLMCLLGRANWWVPGALRRLYDRRGAAPGTDGRHRPARASAGS